MRTDDYDRSEMSDAYQRARRTYGIVSGLLFAWELIGIRFDAKHPVENLNISLKSPQAVPYVLIVLVLYFAFRLTIEWYQNERWRRNLIPVRIDFIVSHALGTLAIILYLLQLLLNVQVANRISTKVVFLFLMGIIFGACLLSLIRAMFIAWRSTGTRSLRTPIGPDSGESMLLGAASFWLLYHFGFSARNILVFLCGGIIGTLGFGVFRVRARPNRSNARR